MAVCNLEFSACYSCVSKGMTLIQLRDKQSYCCIKDPATFLRPIELTYKKLSDCPIEGVANWIVISSIGAFCILALIVLIAALRMWLGKRPARTRPDEQTGLLGTRQIGYGFNFQTVPMVNETFHGSHVNFELIPLEEIVVEGARRAMDNQKPVCSSFKASNLKTSV